MTEGVRAGRSAVIDDLWRYYDEHATQARQHEDLRATVTGALVGIAAAVVALAGVGGLSSADVPAGLVVIALSGLGLALNAKHYERNRFHTEVLNELGNEIDRLRQAPGVRSTRELRKAARVRHKREFLLVRDAHRTGKDGNPVPSPWPEIRLHRLWLGLPVALGLIGVLVVVLALVGVSAK